MFSQPTDCRSDFALGVKIDLKLSLDDQEIEARKFSIALEKRYLIVRSGREARRKKFDLDELVSDDRIAEMQKLFGGGSAGAVSKRGSAILKSSIGTKTNTFPYALFRWILKPSLNTSLTWSRETRQLQRSVASFLHPCAQHARRE